MKKFKVTITETLQHVVYVEATSEKEALGEAEEQYWLGNIVLDSSHYQDTTFKAEETE